MIIYLPYATFMDINPDIFKAYDVRGTYPDQIDGFTAYRIGRAYIHFLRNNPVLSGPIRIVVNADARASSPELKQELIKGMLDEDAHVTVIDAGLSTTPMHSFIVNYTAADGGVMVTASHNREEYNGFKFSRRAAYPVYIGGGLEEVRNIAVRGIFETPQGRGSITQQDFLNDYIDFLRAHIELKNIKRFKIVVDCGNGMAGLVMPKLVAELPIEVEFLFANINMTFPNHEANPIKDETLAVLKKRVVESRADFGVAFDGDGDRVSFMASDGLRVPADYILALFAEHFLKAQPGATVVYDLRASKVVAELIQKAGGVPVGSRVGHTYVRALMREHEAIVGGEISGHFYFKDFFHADSGIFAFLKLLELLSAGEKSLGELVRPLQKYASSGEINIQVPDRERAIDAVAAHFKDAPQISYLDGLSIEYPDFWFNIRASNTEPLLRLVIEGREQGIVEEKLKEIREIVIK